MFPALRRRRPALACFFALASILPRAQAVVPYPALSFLFEWKVPEQTFPHISFPVPVTAQCETIRIEWSRSAATGPTPIPPYYLQVYTSLFLVPIVIPAGMGPSFDWAVPFPPGTLYQICMFDSKGNTGGCQDAYTIIPSATVANCANVTLPPQLDVEGIVDNGPISRYGWIEECTDIELRIKNGTPPYTFTIAPSLHPPYNITGPGPSLNWTVDLSWATPFFISVSDSAGNMWSNGLLHSGGPGDKACLARNSTAKSGSVSPAVGSGFGGLFLGLFIGLASMFLLTSKKIKRLQSEIEDLSRVDLHRSRRFSMSQYLIEPFTGMEDDNNANSPPPASNTSFSPNRRTTVESSSTPRTERIFVVHHDSNAPPFTMYHEDGTRIVDMPPIYREEGGSTPPPRRLPIPPSGSANPEAQSDDTWAATTPTSGTPSSPAFRRQQRQPDHARKPSRDIAYTRLPQE